MVKKACTSAALVSFGWCMPPTWPEQIGKKDSIDVIFIGIEAIVLIEQAGGFIRLLRLYPAGFAGSIMLAISQHA
jgi:hypothetical protein